MVVLLATGGYDQTVRLWDASSGVCYRTLAHPERQVNCLSISPDKQFIVAGGAPALRLYDVNATGPDALLTFEGHSGAVTACGFQRDGRWMFSSSEDGTIRVWDVRAPTVQRTYDARAGVNAVVLHPNQGELISGDAAGTVRVWDLAANRCSAETVPEGDTAPVASVAVAVDASIVVAATYNGACFWWSPRASDDLVPLRRIQAHKAYILAARLSPDARYLATASSDRTVKLWSARDATPIATLAGHARWVWDATFSADSSYLVTASSDMLAKLWEVSSAEVVRTYSGHGKAVTAVALNDAAPVATGGPAPVSTPAAAPAAAGGGAAAGGSTSARG